MGATTTNVVISKDGVPQFVRIIPAGGDEITKALVAKLDMTSGTAEQAKRSIGIGAVGIAQDRQPAVEVIQQATSQLLNGLRNTLDYFVNAR